MKLVNCCVELVWINVIAFFLDDRVGFINLFSAFGETKNGGGRQ